MDANGLAHDLQQLSYDVAQNLLWPVVVAALVCLVWVVIEFGAFIYETYLRIRFRDLQALETTALQARAAFAAGKPRRAYRYLQENRYSMVVARFLFDLIRNYETDRLAEKPLKLLQEYEFYTVKRLEKTRILTRVGPLLGLAGSLIPLAPALVALAKGDTAKLSDNLIVAFSVTVIGLIVGGLAFVISTVRDRYYSQDISDLEYLLELLEGSGERLPRHTAHAGAAGVGDEDDEEGEVDEAGETRDDPAAVTTRIFTTGAAPSETTLAMSFQELQSAGLESDAASATADRPVVAEEAADTTP